MTAVETFGAGGVAAPPVPTAAPAANRSIREKLASRISGPTLGPQAGENALALDAERGQGHRVTPLAASSTIGVARQPMETGMSSEDDAGRALTAQIFGTIMAQRYLLELLLTENFMRHPDPIAICDATERAILDDRPSGIHGTDPDLAYSILQNSDAEIERVFAGARSRIGTRLRRPG